ncbi:hypothetical protein DMX10_09710 [Pseudomonas sp. 57B-090624]|nr:hypothetical protein DMX10_09710 [Pseudomonas sp. 57B-090624]
MPIRRASWKLEAGSWKLEAGSWKLEEPGGSADTVNPWADLFPHSARSPGLQPGELRSHAKPHRWMQRATPTRLQASGFKLPASNFSVSWHTDTPPHPSPHRASARACSAGCAG